MKRITTGWTLMRAIYLAIGSVIAIDAGLAAVWWAVLIGGYFAAMGLFGFGCARGQCALPEPDIHPSEIDNDKR